MKAFRYFLLSTTIVIFLLVVLGNVVRVSEVFSFLLERMRNGRPATGSLPGRVQWRPVCRSCTGGWLRCPP